MPFEREDSAKHSRGWVGGLEFISSLIAISGRCIANGIPGLSASVVTRRVLPISRPVSREGGCCVRYAPLQAGASVFCSGFYFICNTAANQHV